MDAKNSMMQVSQSWIGKQGQTQTVLASLNKKEDSLSRWNIFCRCARLKKCKYATYLHQEKTMLRQSLASQKHYPKWLFCSPSQKASRHSFDPFCLTMDWHFLPKKLVSPAIKWVAFTPVFGQVITPETVEARSHFSTL
jgi:hypothetical protein